MLKRIVSLMLSATMISALLTSCSQPQFDFEFIEEDAVREYTSTVEGSALTIYVDANANEGGDGSEKTPFKTITEAQTKIRSLKSEKGLPSGGITVFVKDGEYRLTEGLVFSEADSGTEECPITYVSESAFGAKITGALLLSAEDFEPINDEEKSRLIDKSAADNIVKVDLAKYGLTSEDWGEYVISGSHHTGQFYDEYADDYANNPIPDYIYIGEGAVESHFTDMEYRYGYLPVDAEAEVFIGDTVLQCARWPNEDWVYAQSLVYFGDSTYGKKRGEIVNPEGPILEVDSSVIERASKWSTYENIWAFGYISTTWADSRNTVVKFDEENNTVQFKYNETYLSEGNIEDKYTRWYFFNIFDELDTAGEFYIDRTNGILYICKIDDFYSERIKMSTITDNLITLDNASNLTFKGFYISETRGNGIYGFADDVTFDNCKICNIRSGGILVRGDRITVQNSEIFNVGTYGIYLFGGDMDTLTRSDNLVYNNYIHDWSRVVQTYNFGIAVEGVGATVSHNEVCNSPHIAITWHGPYNIIEYNEVYNVCTLTADCGAVCTGEAWTSWGSEVRYNYIHDVGSEGVFAAGIYWDNSSSGQTAYGNLIVNVSRFGILIGGGRNNVVENNVFINTGEDPIHYDNRARQWVMKYHNYWFSHTAAFSAKLKPYVENEIWTEAFPVIKDLVFYYEGYEGDVDNPYLTCNPAFSSVKSNISYITIPEGSYDPDDLKHEFQKDVEKFSDVSNNPIIYNDFSDFPGLNNGGYHMKEDSKAKEKAPDFIDLPYAKMGRIE